MGMEKTLYPYDLTSDIAEKISHWLPETLKFGQETTDLAERIEQLASVCNTYGQLIRMWPELEGFMPPAVQTKIAEAAAISKYPEKAFKHSFSKELNTAVRTLRPEFKPTALAPFNALIAECLMLPQVPGGFIATANRWA